MATAKFTNRERILARFKKIMPELSVVIDAQLSKEAHEFADAVRRAVPVKTGTLRSTVRVEPGPRELSYVVKVGGVPATRTKVRKGVKSADFAIAKAHGGHTGEYDYAFGVEFGHLDLAGDHVTAKPFFFPTYRARKKAMRRRIKAAASKYFKSRVDTRSSKG